jgi:inositol transporter-like SP family MFS transporter
VHGTRLRGRQVRRGSPSTVAAGLASYLDASLLVSVAIGLPVWRQQHGLTSAQLGLLTGGLGLAVALGAFVGGRLADRYGRNRVFTLDLLLFVLGVAVVAVAQGAWSLLAGVTLAGLAVGADLPASLAVLAAAAPLASRGRVIGSSQVLWSAGIVVTFALGFVFSGLGQTGVQLLDVHLLLVGMLTLALRWRSWTRPQGELPPSGRPAGRSPIEPVLWLPVIATGLFFLLWNLVATTLGTYGTYFLVVHVGLSQTQATAAVLFTLPPVLLGLAFVRLADTRWRDRLYVVALVLQVTALAVGAATGGSAVAGMVVLLLLWSLSNVFGGEAVYRVWSQLLLHPDRRATDFGVTYGVGRLASSSFLLAVPFLIDRHPQGLLWLLTGFAASAGMVGLVIIRHPQLIPALPSASPR